jgi:hypothetical protein
MFRIQYAWMRLADPDDPAAKGEKQLSHLYGGFSAPFLSPPAASFPSLLGREALARTTDMLWRRIANTRNRIEISGA